MESEGDKAFFYLILIWGLIITLFFAMYVASHIINEQIKHIKQLRNGLGVEGKKYKNKYKLALTFIITSKNFWSYHSYMWNFLRERSDKFTREEAEEVMQYIADAEDVLVDGGFGKVDVQFTPTNGEDYE